MFNPVNKILFYLLIKKHILSSLNNDIGGSNLDQITVNYFSIGNAFKFQLMLPTILRRWISSRGCIHRELGSQKTIRNSAPFLWGGSLQVRFRSFSLSLSLPLSHSLTRYRSIYFFNPFSLSRLPLNLLEGPKDNQKLRPLPMKRLFTGQL